MCAFTWGEYQATPGTEARLSLATQHQKEHPRVTGVKALMSKVVNAVPPASHHAGMKGPLGQPVDSHDGPQTHHSRPCPLPDSLDMSVQYIPGCPHRAHCAPQTSRRLRAARQGGSPSRTWRTEPEFSKVLEARSHVVVFTTHLRQPYRPPEQNQLSSENLNEGPRKDSQEHGLGGRQEENGPRVGGFVGETASPFGTLKISLSLTFQLSFICRMSLPFSQWFS